MTNQYIHRTRNSSMSANYISTNGPLQHITFLPKSSPYTQKDPKTYVRNRVIYNEKNRNCTSQTSNGSRRARISPLHLVEEQINFLLHAQHVRSLALFDLLIRDPPPPIIRLASASKP